MSATELKIELVPGSVAPRYGHDVQRTEVECESVVITEQGMASGLPLLDFKLRGPDGKLYLLVLTGRIVNMVSAAVKGVNMRNHGKAEP